MAEEKPPEPRAEPEIEIQLAIIQRHIFLMRGEKVMLDGDLAELYGVTTKRLNEQVRRNINRFPEDFMFSLSEMETRILRSQFATLKQGQHRKYLPFAFTEQGIAMLSSVLKSDQAVQVNIGIMRAFVRLRKLLAANGNLAEKIINLEQEYDHKLEAVFKILKNMENDSDEKPNDDKPPMGFVPPRSPKPS